jgi:hypothetical protein
MEIENDDLLDHLWQINLRTKRIKKGISIEMI